MGSALKGEEIYQDASCIQERGVWAIGEVKKPGWSFRSAQRNLNLTPWARGTWGRPEDHVTQAQTEIGPSWHKVKGLHRKGVRVSITP